MGTKLNIFPNNYAASSGVIRTTMSLDYESTTDYSVTVTASDGGTPPRTTEALLNITILDENDNSPVLSQRTYTATIPENTGVGLFVIQLQATDIDSGRNAQLTYSIINDGSTEGIFQIDATSGIVTVARSEPLDIERTRMFVLQVQAEDMGLPTARLSTTSLVS